MQVSNGLQLGGLCLALVLVTLASGQETKPASEGLSHAAPIFGGNADQWLQELVDSRVDIDTRLSVDRLSCFHLSPAQVEKLTAAADEEVSYEKRVLLWQAMRQSRDAKTRDYLIRVLRKAGVESQIQFLDEIENLTRFDVPILVALYTGQGLHPTKSASEHSSVAGHRDSGIRDGDALAEFGDRFDVRRRIVELACSVQWRADSTISASWQSAGLPLLDEKVFKETGFNRIQSSELRRGEAELAQEKIVYWLIKNGYEDEHRLKAFETFLNHGKSWRSRHSYVGMGSDLLCGLDKPESRAKAVHLVMTWVDPYTFLFAQEPEIVRLSAIEAMHVQIAQGFMDPHLILFDAKLVLWKPILAQVQDSDPSPKVKAAAQSLLERIADCQQNSERLKQAVARGSR